MSRLKQYKFEFKWEHRARSSMITFIGTSTPRSNEFVSGQAGPSVYVFGILSNEPFIKLKQAPLQQLIAITVEIEKERDRLLQLQVGAGRMFGVPLASMDQVLAYEYESKGLNALDEYLEEQDA